MKYSPSIVQRKLQQWPKPTGYLGLFSGGGDSLALTASLAAVQKQLDRPVRLVHFHHGLSPEADKWAYHCRRVAEQFDLPLEIVYLSVPSGGGGVEARARKARMEALVSVLKPDEMALTGHQANDQAETFLLQALRGAGPTGLAAMPELGGFGAGLLGRPLLRVPRASLASWLKSCGLTAVDDLANYDPSIPRSYLRQRVFPAFERHWPAAARTFSRSALLAGEASSLCRDLAQIDLAGDWERDRLSMDLLRSLTSSRGRNALHAWIERRRLPIPTYDLLNRIWSQLSRGPGNGTSCIEWDGAEARFYRNFLFVQHPLPPVTERGPWLIEVGRPLRLPGNGQVLLEQVEGDGVAVHRLTGALSVRLRQGGEVLRPTGRHRHPLKKWLQEQSILPWTRFRLPLLFHDEVLIAVADLWLDPSWAARAGEAGLRLRWAGHPAYR